MEGTTAEGASAEEEPLPEVPSELSGALRQLVQRGYAGAEAAEALTAAAAAAGAGGGGDDGPAFRGALQALFGKVLESAAPEAAASWPASASAQARARARVELQCAPHNLSASRKLFLASCPHSVHIH